MLSCTSIHGKLYRGYADVVRICFGVICCLCLSNVRDSVVKMFTAVKIKRVL